MKRIILSAAQANLSLLWEYSQAQREAILLLRATILDEPARIPSSLAARFFVMTSQRVNQYFADLSKEIDQQASLNLIAAAEAAITVDFLNRVQERPKSALTRPFRQLAKRAEEENRRVRLGEILEIWLVQEGSPRKLIEEFRGALNYRHWLAHGRYWSPKLGRKYDPVLVQTITAPLLSALKIR